MVLGQAETATIRWVRIGSVRPVYYRAQDPEGADIELMIEPLTGEVIGGGRRPTSSSAREECLLSHTSSRGGRRNQAVLLGAALRHVQKGGG